MRSALALILVLVSALSGWARPVIVSSGEHKDFTRLVLQFDGKPDWQFGRTLDGYALRVPGQTPQYDLAKAFDLIGKTRLAALQQDPQTGDLTLGIACSCHAVPFEFRPGIVVVDLYDGVPQAGSSFEQPLPPLATAPAAAPPAPAPVPPAPAPDAQTLVTGYDWTKLSLESMGLALGEPPQQAQNRPVAAPPDALDPNLDKLRETLVRDMGAGATAGLIQLAPPKPGPETAPQTSAGTTPASEADIAAQLQTHLGETPAFQLRDVGEPRVPLTASGATCLPDEALDLASWGADRPVAEQLGPIREGMIGEFDKPAPEAIKRVIRFYLYLGFGAEARSLLRAYPDLFPEAPLWTAMAHILDGEPEKDGIFKGMEECDTSAALWAVLADPKALPHDDVGRAAVARSFSALPAAIRRLLGPGLVETYLNAGDIQTATALSESVLRAPGDAGPAVVMMQADMARALGHNGEAEAKLEPLATKPGPASSDALVDLGEHRAGLGQTVSHEDVVAVEAALKERRGSAEEPRYRKALVLAKAASGDFDAAFAESADPDARAAIWRLLAQAGGDTPLLNHATLGPDQAPPAEARDSAGLIADRLLMLGLADQAARWLPLAPHAPALLRARVALANGDATGAMSLIQDDTSEQALHVKAEAMASLGDQAGAAKIYADLGKSDQQWATLSAAQSWPEISKDGPAPWKDLAGIVTGSAPAIPPDPTQPNGPLAQDKQLVGDSATTRDAITNLLNSVQVPGTPSQ